MTKETLKAHLIRKPCNLTKLREELEDAQKYGEDAKENLVIIEKHEISNEDYDKLAACFFDSNNLIAGKGGFKNIDGVTHIKVIEIASLGKDTLLIDSSGYNYARYVAIKP